jgi:hypothetical protein
VVDNDVMDNSGGYPHRVTGTQRDLSTSPTADVHPCSPGLEPSAATQGKTFYESGVSLENAGELKADLIVILATADDIEELKQDRAFAALPGIRDSHVEFLELGTDKDLDLIAAINGPDPASLAWEKDKLAAMAGKATH